MELQITCEGSDVINYKTIKNLQGSLKTRTMDDIEGMIKYIIQDGFSFPLFIYKHGEVNYTIDGHGRLLALSMMENTGYCLDESGVLRRDGDPWTIPPVPCVYIHAKDMKEAKIKLLKLNSEYGTITQAGFKDFTKDLDVEEYSGIPLRIADIGTMGDIDPLANFGDIIPWDIGNNSPNEPETDFAPALDPKIDTSIITEEAIEKAIEKEHNKKELDVSTMRLTCKHCGKIFVIRKSDAKYLINQKIKELNDA